MYESNNEARDVTPHDGSAGQHKTSIPIIYIVGPIAALAGLLFGMDIGVISGALPLIAEAFHASDLIQELVVSAMMLGAAVGAISNETARLMAVGAVNRAGVDLAVSITGIAGPGGGSADKPVGLVFLGVATRDDVRSERHLFPGDRNDIRHAAMIRALEMLKAAAG